MKPRSVALFLLMALLAVPAAEAATLLTNGVPVQFVLPLVGSTTILRGDIGYAIYVPPGATRLTVTFQPFDPFYNADLLVRRDADVGYAGNGTIFADYITRPGLGVKTIEASGQSSPPLLPGTYFIGFQINTFTTALLCELTATVEGGSVLPIRMVGLSNFDNDADGWTRNSSDGGLPGASAGDETSAIEWQSAGGNPSGYLRFNEGGAPNRDALLAPAKFLGRLTGLEDGRFEFDFKTIAGVAADLAVEIRIFGAGTAFAWLGSIPPGPPDPTPWPLPPSFPPGQPPQPGPNGPPDYRWRHFTALLDLNYWSRLAGEARFSQVLANVQRIEVITDLAVFGESSGLDNFAIVARGIGPPAILLPSNTSFAAGPDGWGRNYPGSELGGATTGNADSTFRWSGFEGNPGGHVRLNNSAGAARDYFVAPGRFIGNYSSITDPQLEFDYLHTSRRGATQPVEMRLIGVDTVWTWSGPTPARIWTHYVAPLREAAWRRLSGAGTFQQTLADVRRLEISADQATGPESNEIDNFWLLPALASPAPPTLSANPETLFFQALVRGSNPPPRTVGVTSMGGGPALRFTAASSAPWLKLSAAAGTTPRELEVWPELTGLGEGTYTGTVNVVHLGSGLEPRKVEVTLTVALRPGPIPRISPGGVVNSASNRGQLAPGGLATLYGTGLGPASGVAAAFLAGPTRLPTTVQGVRVLVNETYGALIGEAPLLYVGEGQINFQLPFETFGRSEVRLVVDNNGNLSESMAVQVVPTSPGIFTWGENRAVAVNQNGAVNSPQSAAPRGSLLTVYMTGQGVVTPAVDSGRAAPARPLARSPHPAQAWIGGTPAPVQFVGLAPGLVGVLQVNLEVPFRAPEGDSPLLINLGGWTSNTGLVTVGPPPTLF